VFPITVAGSAESRSLNFTLCELRFHNCVHRVDSPRRFTRSEASRSILYVIDLHVSLDTRKSMRESSCANLNLVTRSTVNCELAARAPNHSHPQAIACHVPRNVEACATGYPQHRIKTDQEVAQAAPRVRSRTKIERTPCQASPVVSFSITQRQGSVDTCDLRKASGSFRVTVSKQRLDPNTEPRTPTYLKQMHQLHNGRAAGERCSAPNTAGSSAKIRSIRRSGAVSTERTHTFTAQTGQLTTTAEGLQGGAH